MTTPLNPLEVVLFVFTEYREYWKDQCKISHDVFLDLLEIKALDHSAISRTLNQTGSPSGPIVDALERVASQINIAQKLKIADIFDCVSREQLRAKLDLASQSECSKTKLPPRLWEINAGSDNNENLCLSLQEKTCIEAIKEALINPTSPITLWSADFYSGASVCAYALSQDLVNSSTYNSVYFVQASSIVNPFNYELEKLASNLGVERAVHKTGTRLFEKLVSTNALLIVCNSDLIPELQSNKKYSIVHGLLNEAVHRIVNWSDAARVLLVGPELKFGNPGKDCSNLLDVNTLLTNSKQPRIDFFSIQHSRFCEIRNSNNVIEHSTRHKRVKWHYEETKTNEGWPVNVRVRAFFASNYQSYAYFDSTRGFSKLAGSLAADLPIDISLFKNDVQLKIDTLKSQKNKTEIRILRFFSTALYWLTRDTLTVLVKNDNTLNVRQISDTKLQEGIHNLRDTIRIIEPGKDNDLNCDAYVLNLGIKSIVQDDWVSDNPIDRSLAHWRIADRFHSLQHSKSQLLKELPFVPHWGRTRIYLLVETFRHLIRSCELSKHCDSENYDIYSIPDFPSRPSVKLNGSDPYVIFNFCFQKIYRTEINGNQGAMHSGSLSKRHGAYHLAAELIEMLCLNSDLSLPSPYLNKKFHLNIQRDASFALIDLGEISKANSVTKKRLDAIENDTDAAKKFDTYLDLALINTTMGHLDAADSNITNAVRNLEEIKSKTDDLESSHRKNWSIRSKEKRVKARSAHILYLRGQNSRAIELYETLNKKEIRDEIAHCYIAALGARGDASDIQNATAICLANMFDLTSKGHQHNALGFRVALAHLFRKMNMYDAAETCLDQVLLDILEFGCSERINQSFLLEAGRYLIIRNRPAKAFAIYLRPGLLRAQQSQIQRTMQSFVKNSIQSLKQIDQLLSNYDSIEKWKEYLHTELQLQDLFQERITPKTVGYFSTDPLASFDLITDYEIIDILSTSTGINKEIAELELLVT